MRLVPGDRLIGLDGRGSSWPLIVTDASGRELRLAADGEPTREPAPGTAGASLPWIELLVAWPKGARAEAMLERLAQLGVACVRPWVTSRGQSATGNANRERRLARVLAESCKQSGRLWLPELGPELVGLPDAGASPATQIVLDPRATHGLAQRASEALAANSERFLLAIGPEGGLTSEELEDLSERGFEPVRLGPHVLRIETAAEAALAVVAHLAQERRTGVTRDEQAP